MTRYKAVLFDLDGTLLDTYELIMSSMRHTAKGWIDRPVPDAELSCGIGTPLYDQMVVLAEGDLDKATKMTAYYREHNEAVHDQMVHPFDGIPEMLQTLRDAGLKVGVVTSKRHELALRGLTVCGLDGFMDLIIGPDDFPEHKPKPGPVLEGCRRLGLPPAECFYVGDSPYDLQAGNAAGCSTVAVRWGMFDDELLAAENPTFFIDAPAQMVELAVR